MELLKLKYKHIGINSQDKRIVYLKLKSEARVKAGLEVLKKVSLTCKNKTIIGTVHLLSNGFISENEIGLSDFAQNQLEADEGDEITVELAKMPNMSLNAIRSKMYGGKFTQEELNQIISDTNQGLLSNVHLAAFISSSAGNNLDVYEITALTKAMVNIGDRLQWDSDIVVDKHCIGGILGNRTTPIVVPIVAAAGLKIPKTSSRAITSPAGTADTLEAMTNIELDLEQLRNVVEKENACLAWGGSMKLSPADDILIKIERLLNVDSKGQMIASVLSKKVAAGSTHVLIDIPVGLTAKIKSMDFAEKLKSEFEFVSSEIGLKSKVIISDGRKPIGRGIGPALEAKDVLKVLKNEEDAPIDLRKKSIKIAAEIFKMALNISQKEAIQKAQEILDSGKAYDKFIAICTAQGAVKKLPTAKYTYEFKPVRTGKIIGIDNSKLSNLAKLVGAPENHAAGLELVRNDGDEIISGDTVIILHSDSEKLLNMGIDYLFNNKDLLKIAEI